MNQDRGKIVPRQVEERYHLLGWQGGKKQEAGADKSKGEEWLGDAGSRVSDPWGHDERREWEFQKGWARMG